MADVRLKYKIHKFSSFSSDYIAENILTNNPSDQSSRWSSDSNNPPQYITLKLDFPAIVKYITFGKFERTHVCNLKKFKIYGGLNDANQLLLLEGGLKNDNQAEQFPLKHCIFGNYFPCRYIRIEPIQSYGPNFNFSIWYVQLDGNDTPSVVRPCLNWYNTYREQEVVRLCLKHFRQHDYTEVYEALLRKTNVELEHPLLTELHKELVSNGNYDACEKLIEKACDDGLFDTYIKQLDYMPKWTPIEPMATGFGDDCRPGMRGGHQMVMDAAADIIYLFGGWDGSQDLADLWAYDVQAQRWNCLSKNTEDDGGPSARSCHKICVDHVRKQLFTLGKFLDSAMRTDDNLKSDFYMYDIASRKWTLITDDTSAMGGPSLVFDHQMAIDVDRRTIYVFGGRVQKLSGLETSIERAEASFSGLYSYHIPTNTWCRIMQDCPTLRSRIGHSMLFHPGSRSLYIFAGQRSKESLKDFLVYNVDTGHVDSLTNDAKTEESLVPAAGFTQRATFDPDLCEIHVFSGVRKDKDRTGVKNSFWIYEIKKAKWTCIYKNDYAGQPYWERVQRQEPVPRFAHQLVYNHNTRVHYLFGGNPSKENLPKMRLDDFWSLKLCRPSVEHLHRRCKFLLRKQRYEETVLHNPVSAICYLQTQVKAAVNMQDKAEREEFEALGIVVLNNSRSRDTDDVDMDLAGSSSEDNRFTSRTQLFDTLVSYFPDHMTQPKGSLMDLITPP